MSISAEEVKKLRDMTGAGMMDAKQALKECNSDLEEAVKIIAGSARSMGIEVKD